MPRQATKFRENWLTLVDKNGTELSEWCVKGRDDYSAYCFLCKTTVNIDNSGKIQLMQHANTSKHKLVDGARKDSSQSRLVNIPGSKGICLDIKQKSSNDLKQTWTVNEEDKVCKTEILWTIHVALNNYSFLSCDAIKTLFSEMFPDSSLPQGIQLSSRKVSYTISHGLGPYFLKQITDEFREKSPFFTLMYDETLNEQNLKQLDVYVRYWNSKESCISERYVGSELMGHATALDISASIKSVLKSCNIHLKWLLMLGSDGPNVNKTVFQLFDKEIKLIRDFGLINVGTCNLHIIHNAFGTGIKIESFTNVIDFLENIHCWFAKFPSRQEDLKKAMEEFGNEFEKVLRYVSNRWLSVVKVCERTLDLMPSLKIYFLEDLPKEKNRLVKNDRYKSIVKMLESQLTPLYLHFMISVGSLFEQFLKLLQQESTLIHILYDELTKLLSKLMRRFVHENVLKEKNGEELLNIDVLKESVSAKNVDVGNITKKHLNSLSPELKAEFLADAKQFYVVVTTYLQEKLPIQNKFLQYLQILHPLVRKEPLKCSLPTVRRLANLLPLVIPENCVDKLTDEWRLYTSDFDICEEWSYDNASKLKPIDHFWNHVFNLVDSSTGSPRYPYLTVLVKAVLTFSHGQASVERGFSINKRMLTSERSSMNIDTIQGLRIIKDAVRGKATDVCFTQEMIQFYKEAYSKYKAKKESQKKEIREKTNLPEKKKPSNKLAEVKEVFSSAQAMIEEGNKRLQMGLKRKSMKEIETAQALIDAGNKKLKIANEEFNKKGM